MLRYILLAPQSYLAFLDFEAETVVKEAAADADGNRQSVGAELFAEDVKGLYAFTSSAKP